MRNLPVTAREVKVPGLRRSVLIGRRDRAHGQRLATTQDRRPADDCLPFRPRSPLSGSPRRQEHPSSSSLPPRPPRRRLVSITRPSGQQRSWCRRRRRGSIPQHQLVEDMAAPSGVDQQFVMLRTSMRERIFEYIGRKQSTADWRRRLPELARRLEDILYAKFPDMNDYYNMMKGPVEPQLQYAIRTLSAQNQQNQQNPQMARGTASSFATMTPVGNHVALCEQSASLVTDTQTSNADECARTDTGLLQHQRMEDMANLSGMDGQFVMLRTAMNEKIFEYIGKKQMSPQWRKRLPELAKRLEEILYTKFPNRNDYYNMMKGPLEPPLLYAIRTLSAQNQQNQQNPEMARDTASSSATMTLDVNHGDLCGQFASLLLADVQNNNADELGRTE